MWALQPLHICTQDADKLFAYNSVDPIGDAGQLVHLLDPSTILPLVVVLGTLTTFVLSWAIAARLDAAAHREREYPLPKRIVFMVLLLLLLLLGALSRDVLRHANDYVKPWSQRLVILLRE
jgi:hypothetical protein